MKPFHPMPSLRSRSIRLAVAVVFAFVVCGVTVEAQLFQRLRKANPSGSESSGNSSEVEPAMGSKVTRGEAERIVAFHNEKRAAVGSGPLTWSVEIAAHAQKRADEIARTKRFSHLPSTQNRYGENLAKGGSGGESSGFTVLHACEGWYDEKKKMPPNARTMTAALFNRGVGHYTQMVWKGSTEIGAGIAHYEEGGFHMTVVVCCYNPRGNVLNEPIY